MNKQASKMIEFRVGSLESAVKDIRDAVNTIAKNSDIITRLETHHEETRDALTRAFKDIETNRTDYEKSCKEVDERLRPIEMQMPLLKLTSRWIIGGVVTVVGGVFATAGIVIWALLPLILKMHTYG